METAWQFLKNITTEFPYDPEIALLDICLKNSKILISKVFANCAHCSITHGGQDVGTTQCPLTEDWRMKMWYIYTVGYNSAMRKDEKLPFLTTWIDLENITLSEMQRTM